MRNTNVIIRTWVILSTLCLFLILGFHANYARSAANVSYAWTDQQTIRVTGSSLKSPVSMVVSVISLEIPGAPNLPGIDDEQGSVVAIDKADDCEFTLAISINTSGVASAKGREGPNQLNTQGGSTTKTCTSAIYDQYTKSPISFTNSRSGSPVADETGTQKTVGVVRKSSLPINEAPASITATISPAPIDGGPTTVTLTLQKITDPTYVDALNAYIYSGAVQVEPGKYVITFYPAVIPAISGSTTFEKIKYQPTTVRFGESTLDRTVNVALDVTYTGLSGDEYHTVPPIPITITSTTDPSFNRTENTDIFLSQAHVTDFVANLQVNFSDIPAGTYKVCALSSCNEFTKVEGIAANVSMSATGADVDKEFVVQDTSPTCESTVGGFGWLLCPALGYIDSFIGWAESAISSQLTVDLGTQETRDSLQDAWRVVARFSSGILVAIALVMVISTALGSDLVSPYALKKILPRLVIGAIGIWLSWALVSTYIDIMNDLGKGIAGILTTPFAPAKDFTMQNIATNIGINSGSSGASSTIFVGLATAGIVSAGVFGILSAALTALFAFVVAIVVLALRQAVIIFLIVLAPLGFAMWILPNTQKIWKLWSGTLNKLLLMYPMIMGLLAAGKIFAYITSESAGTGGTIDQFLAFSISLIAYVAPYFFLPALFKAAGGVFSNLTGMVNDKGKGLYDKYKGSLDAKGKSRQTFKDQLKSEKQARRAAGQGFRSSFSRAGMRAQGGQPIVGGALTLRNRAAAKQRVQSSMAAAQDKLEEQQIQEETARMANTGMLNNRDGLRVQAATGSVVQRRAAINRLMQISDDEGMRSIKSASMASSDNRVRDMWGKVQSSKELNDAFKDSAPDILRGAGAFSGGFNTSMLTKASKNTYAQATAQYKEANRLLSGLGSGAISPDNLSSDQTSLLGEYVNKTKDGELILDAASYTDGISKLQNAIKVTAASAKEATLNPAIRAEFKTAQATEALKMLNSLDTTFVGIASPDIAAVGSRIDPTTGLR